MSEVAQLVEHERKMDHVCDPNSNLSFHAKDVVGGSSPSLTLYGDVVQPDYICVCPKHDLQQNLWAIRKIKGNIHAGQNNNQSL